MALIQIQNLTFAYDGSYDDIFTNASFAIDSNWKTGLIGRNGRGKTTLLRLMQGQMEYKGKITSELKFDYFPYKVSDMAEITLDILQRLCFGTEQWRIEKELSLLEVEADVLYRPFETLSNGEQTKVLLAALFLKENNFLLIDEPTNHLDRQAREKVAGYLQSKQGFLLVSHDRNFLDSCIDHVLAVNRSDIEVINGGFSTWRVLKQQTEKRELEQNKQLKKEIGRLTEAARRAEKWSDKVEATKKGGVDSSGLKPDKGHIGRQAARMMKRSKVIQTRNTKAAEEKQALFKNQELVEDLKLSPLQHHAKTLLFSEGLTLSFGEKTVFKDVAVTVQNEDRLVLAGINGSGKSSLIKILTGEIIDFKGELQTAAGLKISYVPQNSVGLCGSLDDYIHESGVDETQFKTILRKFGFERVQFEKDMQNYSAGQKKKVLLAKSLCEKAHLYIWDEPLNYIDVFSRMQIEELILQSCPAMIFIEHDKAFCENISTKILDLGTL